MSSDAHDFDEKLEQGLKWESELADTLETILVTKGLEQISFEDNAEMQRSGIDLVLQQDSPNIDVKCREHYAIQFGDILLETWSVYEENKRGWVYKPDIDLVAYVFENRPGTNLQKGYFIVMSDVFREWFQENATEYPQKVAENSSFGGYTTVNRAVPMEDFPEETLIEFDPALPEPQESPQTNLTEYGGDAE